MLLDKSVPWRLGLHLTGHSFTSVQKHGWASIKNGKLLALAVGEFDVLLTADKGMEYQQNPVTLPVAIHLDGHREVGLPVQLGDSQVENVEVAA